MGDIDEEFTGYRPTGAITRLNNNDDSEQGLEVLEQGLDVLLHGEDCHHGEIREERKIVTTLGNIKKFIVNALKRK